MGFWTWFWIWLVLSIAALAVLALIAKALVNKLGSAAHQAARLAETAQPLVNALDAKPAIERPSDSLLADPAIARARLISLQKAKIKKREKRQRRLIESLKRFDPNESRFH